MYAFPQFFLSDTWTLITQNVWFPISLHVPAFLCLSVCVCVKFIILSVYRKTIKDLRERHNRNVKVMAQVQREEKLKALDCLRKLNPEDGHSRTFS